MRDILDTLLSREAAHSALEASFLNDLIKEKLGGEGARYVADSDKEDAETAQLFREVCSISHLHVNQCFAVISSPGITCYSNPSQSISISLYLAGAHGLGQHSARGHRGQVQEAA